MKHSRILIFLMLLRGFLFPAAARALDTPSMGEAISDMNRDVFVQQVKDFFTR